MTLIFAKAVQATSMAWCINFNDKEYVMTDHNKSSHEQGDNPETITQNAALTPAQIYLRELEAGRDSEERKQAWTQMLAQAAKAADQVEE